MDSVPSATRISRSGIPGPLHSDVSLCCLYRTTDDDTVRHRWYPGGVARWDPGTEQRLTQAALDLFGAYGYDDVTITQIAERAGITRRSYFRYFPDKREVLFARSEQLPPAVAEAVLAVDEHADPLSAALCAVIKSGTMLVTQTERAAERRAIISASPELQERDRTKAAAIAAAIEKALRHRGSTPAEAKLVAQIAMVVFENAYLRWLDAGGSESFAGCVRDVAAIVRGTVTGTGGPATESQEGCAQAGGGT